MIAVHARLHISRSCSISRSHLITFVTRPSLQSTLAMREPSIRTAKPRRVSSSSKPVRQSSCHAAPKNADNDARSAVTTNTAPEPSQRKSSSSSKPIRRPPNGWILYRAAKVKQLSDIGIANAEPLSSLSSPTPGAWPDHYIQLNDEQTSLSAKTTTFSGQKELSSYISKCWEAEGTAGKQPWLDLSSRLNEEHKRKYPMYKYQPNRPKAEVTKESHSPSARPPADNETVKQCDSSTRKGSKGKGKAASKEEYVAPQSANLAPASTNKRKKRPAPRPSGGNEGTAAATETACDRAIAPPSSLPRARSSTAFMQHTYSYPPPPLLNSTAPPSWPGSSSVRQRSNPDTFAGPVRGMSLSALPSVSHFNLFNELAPGGMTPSQEIWPVGALAGSSGLSTRAVDSTPPSSLPREHRGDVGLVDACARCNGASKPPSLQTQQTNPSTTASQALSWDTTFNGTTQTLYDSTLWNDWRADLPQSCSSAASETFGWDTPLSLQQQQQQQACMSAPADMSNWLLASPFPTFDPSFAGIASGLPTTNSAFEHFHPTPPTSHSTEADSLYLSTQQLSDLISMNMFLPPLPMPTDSRAPAGEDDLQHSLSPCPPVRDDENA